MNVYIRYFDHEDVFKTPEEVIGYLVAIDDFVVTEEHRQDIYGFFEVSANAYPARVRVRPNVYFIMIKTDASDLKEFKENGKTGQKNIIRPDVARKQARSEQLESIKEGWYNAKIVFKRVILIPGTQKCQYYDTPFSAFVYANSGMDCYNKMITFLKNRQDVDPRSQFPSAKGANFLFAWVDDNTIIESDQCLDS